MTQLLENPQNNQPSPKKVAWVIPNVSWEQLEKIDAAFAPTPGIKFFYLDETLEIVTIGEEHEDFKFIIRKLLETYLDYAGIRYYGRGSPTFGDREKGARGEPDESYNLETKKNYPDLVIEVIETSGGIDKLTIYQRLGVKEVWFWEDGVLTIHHLGKTDYTQIARSQLLENLPFDLFCRYITYHDEYDAVVEFREALKNQGDRRPG